MNFRVYALALLLAGCGTSSAPSIDAPKEATAPATSYGFLANENELSLDVIRADLDLGKDPTAARASLIARLESHQLKSDSEIDAWMLRARAEEAQADIASATASIEVALAKIGNDRDSVRQREAEKTLRRLLGVAARTPHHRASNDVIAPVARALSAAYPTTETTDVHLQILRFGGDERVADELGTYHLADALKEAAEKVVSSKEPPSVHTQESHFSDWIAIPGASADLPTSLVVLYYDSEGGKIATRYERYLPMPSAEIDRRLARGEGVIVVQTRPHAPPVVLLAAPRPGQLEAVERSFAALATLPTGPVKVDLPKHLTPREIQNAMRDDFPAFRACYAPHIGQKLVGTAILNFAIDGDGAVRKSGVSLDASLKNSELESCLTHETDRVQFPKTHTEGETTVHYPIQFAAE